jgi:hypothetical protein
MKIVINNLKIFGAFTVICLLSLPLIGFSIRIMEILGNNFSAVIFSLLYMSAVTYLYFIVGKRFIKSSGSLFHDGFSFTLIILFYTIVIAFAAAFEFVAVIAFAVFNPFFVLLIVAQELILGYIGGLIICAIISVTAMYVGMIFSKANLKQAEQTHDAIS